MAFPFVQPTFTQQFEDGYRAVRIYIQSNVDAGYVADLQRMVTSRGGTIVPLPKDADVIVIVKPDTDLGSLAVELYSRDLSKPVVGVQWVNQCCFDGLLWGPDWGGHRILLPGAALPNGPRQPSPGHGPPGVGIFGAPSRSDPPVAPPAQDRRALRRAEQVLRRQIKKEEPHEVIDVDAISSNAPSPEPDRSDGEYNDSDDEMRQAIPHITTSSQGKARKRSGRTRKPTRKDFVHSKSHSGPRRTRIDFVVREFDEMAASLSEHPEAFFPGPGATAEEKAEATSARKDIWHSHAQHPKHWRKATSYINAHRNHATYIEGRARELIAQRARLIVNSEAGPSSRPAPNEDSGRPVPRPEATNPSSTQSATLGNASSSSSSSAAYNLRSPSALAASSPSSSSASAFNMFPTNFASGSSFQYYSNSHPLLPASQYPSTNPEPW